MKSFAEMKQHIIEQANELHSIDEMDMDWWERVEYELVTDIIELALEGNHIKGNDKKKNKKLFDEEDIYAPKKRSEFYYNLSRPEKD